MKRALMLGFGLARLFGIFRPGRNQLLQPGHVQYSAGERRTGEPLNGLDRMFAAQAGEMVPFLTLPAAPGLREQLRRKAVGQNAPGEPAPVSLSRELAFGDTLRELDEPAVVKRRS